MRKINKYLILIIMFMTLAFVFVGEVDATSTTSEVTLSVGNSTAIECGNGSGSIKELIDEYWGYVMVVGPVLLIVMMSIEVVKTMFKSDSDLLKKLVDSSVKRTLAAILLFCLPVIIRTVLEIFGLDLCL